VKNEAEEEEDDEGEKRGKVNSGLALYLAQKKQVKHR